MNREYQVKEHPQRLSTILDSICDAVIATDTEGMITFLNPAAAVLTGWSSEEALGLSVERVLIRETSSPPLTMESVQDGQAKGLQQAMLLTKDQTSRPVEYNASLLQEEEGEPPVGLALVIRDITHHKCAEKELRELNQQLICTNKELLQRACESIHLNEMSEFLQSSQTVEDVYQVIQLMVPKLFSGLDGLFAVWEPSSFRMKVIAEWGSTHSDEPTDDFRCEACWALRRNTQHMIKAGDSGLFCEHLGDMRPATSLCLPVNIRGRVRCLLHLRQPDHIVADFHSSTQQLAQSMLWTIKLSLSNLELRQELKEQSIRDPLTGLFNRRFMEEVLEQELSRAVRESYPVSIALLDIDHFHTINKEWGSQAGDRVLQVLGDLLRTSTRREDTVCRFGGEEFLVLLPNTTAEVAQKRVEQWRSDFGARQIQYDNETIRATLSGGIVSAPIHGKAGRELLRVADYALYQAKAEGRNRSIVWQVANTTPGMPFLLRDPFSTNTGSSLSSQESKTPSR